MKFMISTWDDDPYQKALVDIENSCETELESKLFLSLIYKHVADRARELSIDSEPKPCGDLFKKAVINVSEASKDLENGISKIPAEWLLSCSGINTLTLEDIKESSSS